MFAKIRPVIYALIFAAAAAAGVGFMWVTVQSMGNDLNEQIALIEEQQKFEIIFSELMASVDNTVAEREQLEKYILNDENDTIALLSELDAISNRHGIQLATRELRVEETTGRFDRLVVGFNLDGPERQIMDMVRLFENLPYHGHVTNLTLQRRQSSPGIVSSVSASISLALSIRKYDE